MVQAAIQRASSARTRAFAFSFWYVSFNLAGTLSGPLVIDVARRAFLDPATGTLARRTLDLPLLGERSMSAHGVILGLGFFFAVAGLLTTLLLRRGFEDRVDPEDGPPPERRSRGFVKALREVAGDRAFWRFVLLMVFLSLVRMMFQHMHFTWPKYVLREQGEGFPVGTIWSLNTPPHPGAGAGRHRAHPQAPAVRGAAGRGLHLGGQPVRALPRLGDAVPDRHDPGADGR